MATDPTAAGKKAPVMKKVRVLVATGDALPNHVIHVAEGTDLTGWADDTPEAVAYAEANEPQPEVEA